MPKTMIDQLEPGDRVVLRFKGGVEENATFVGLGGEGELRRAMFEQADTDGRKFVWEAYRYSKRWSYGTSADRLQLVRVIE